MFNITVKFLSALFIFVAHFLTLPVWGQNLPVSGHPLKSGITYSPFALPSINGCIMGLADIVGGPSDALFMTSDKFNAGTFYYPFKTLDSQGVPVFGSAQRIQAAVPDEDQSRAVILQNQSQDILGFWASGKSLVSGKFDVKTNAFSTAQTIVVNHLPGTISHFGVFELSAGQYLFTFTVADTVVNPKYPVPSQEPEHQRDYRSYGLDGFWQTQLPKTGIYGAFVKDLNLKELNVQPLTDLNQTYYNLEGYCLYQSGDRQYLLAGSTLGNIHAYQIDVQNKKLSFSGYLKDGKNQVLRNPAIHQYLTYFEAKDGDGLMSAGEGGIWFYKKIGGSSIGEDLIFEKPAHVLQTNADLYGGTLVVPELVDWDQDGDLDIVSGNSMGNIQFFANLGTSEAPKFQSPVNLKAGGYPIHIQPGYNQDIQGPFESRWGYACPAVYDWTGDGLPDILTGDSRGKFNIYINTGKKGEPFLEPEHPIYSDGLDLFGTWRVKPGVGEMDGKNAYIILDDDDEFHLYWQLDHFNVTDAGKLMIGDTMSIRANFRGRGAAGRSKFHIVDWDQDGVKDMLVGLPKHSTVPEPEKGMPYRLREKMATVLFLRNAGSESKPVFEYPVPLRFKGERLKIGHHSCTPTTGYFGPGGTLNLVVGDETGRFFFYERKDLQWSPYPLDY